MSKKIDKNDLKGPDSFQATSHVVLEWIQKHAGLVLSVTGLAIVGTAAWLTMSYLQHKKEQAAVDAIYSSEAALKKAEEKVREDRAKKMQESLKTKKSAAEPVRPVDFASDYAPLVEKLKVAIQENASTRAAVISALNLSGFLIQQKRYEEALAVLDLPKFKPGQKDVLSGFWHMHRGLTLLENKKADEALEIYNSVLSSEPLKAFHPEALLKAGVAWEVKGDVAKARETYEKLSREHPNTEASTSAQQYLRLIDLKDQKG